MNDQNNIQKAQELLPWYVNGSLDEAETRFVQQMLEQHPELQQELDQTAVFNRAVNTEQACPDVPSAAASFESLRAKIQTQAAVETSKPRQPRESWLNQLSEWLFSPRGFAMACSVAVCAIAVSLFVNQPQQTEFVTLSDPEVAQTAGGPQLRVVFAPGMTDQELIGMVTQANGSIVGGPTNIGAYTIEFANDVQRQSAMTSWRQNTSFRLVEPVSSE